MQGTTSKCWAFKMAMTKPSVSDFRITMSQSQFAMMIRDLNSLMGLGAFFQTYGISINRAVIRDLDELIDHLLKLVYGDEAKTSKEITEDHMRQMENIFGIRLR